MILGLTALVLWLFRKAVFGGQVFFKRDIHLIWHAQIEGFVRAIAAGSWPVWDPCPAFGQPLLADPSAQVLYPPTWLNLILPPWYYYSFFVAIHVFLSGLSLWALARRWGLSPGGSFLAGAVWILSGPYLSIADLWHHFAGASWIPLVTLAADVAFERRDLRHGLLLGATVAGQVLAGSADMSAMTVLAVAGYAASQHVAWRSPFGPSNRRLARLALQASLFAVGLSAALWLPVLDLAARSARSSLPPEIRTYWSVHPLGILETLVPGLWSTLPLNADLRAALFESREPLIGSLYLGLPALGLVAAGLVASSHRHRTFLALLFGAAALLALGRYSPVYDLAVVVLPPLRILRYPVKAMVVAGFAWALLAGIGFDAWRRAAAPRRLPWTLAVTLPILLLVLMESGAALFLSYGGGTLTERLLDPRLDASIRSETLATAANRLALGAGLALAALALSIARNRPSAPQRLGFAAGVLALSDLALFHQGINPVGRKEIYGVRPPTLGTLSGGDHSRVYVYDYSRRDKSRLYLKREIAGVLARTPPDWPVDSAMALAMQMYLAPATAGRWGLLGSYEIDYRGLYPWALAQITLLLREVEGTPAHLRLLRLGSVTHVVARHEKGFEDLVPVATHPGLFVEPTRVFRVPDPLPHTYAVGGVRVARGPEAFRILLGEGFDPWHEVILPVGQEKPPGSTFAGASRFLEAGSDRVVLEADLREPGYVVVTDSYDPGWRATVDGRETPVLAANLIFRAVHVPAGRHTIEYAYRPKGVTLGLLATATTLVLALAALLRSAPERR